MPLAVSDSCGQFLELLGLKPHHLSLCLRGHMASSLCLSVSPLSVCVIQLCPTLCDPTDLSPPGFSVHGILQARILEWVAIPFSSGSS